MAAQTILPALLFDFYTSDRLTPLLALALTKVKQMFTTVVNCRKTLIVFKAVAGFLRQYALTLLLGKVWLQAGNDEFGASAMVGHERVRELFKNQCQTLYPDYKTLMVGSRWLQDLQQYKSAF